MPRSISASARRSSPSPEPRRVGGPVGASSRCACSATAGRSPRWRANRRRTTARTTCERPRRSAGTESSPRVASARYRSASSSDPRASSSAAIRAASSASAAITSAGNRARSSCAVAPSPLRPRPTQWSASSAGGQGPVLRRLGVADRLDRVPVVREPPGGRGVQRGQFGRRGAAQLQLQQVGEQLVVAEPGPPRIQRDHERARLLELLQDPLPARAPGQQVGQLAVHPLQHRGPQQQPPDRLALPVEHLGQQVFRHRPLAAGELGREPVRIRVPGQRQRRQPQPRRPALGPLVQQRRAPNRTAVPRPPRTAPAPRRG